MAKMPDVEVRVRVGNPVQAAIGALCASIGAALVAGKLSGSEVVAWGVFLAVVGISLFVDDLADRRGGE